MALARTDVPLERDIEKKFAAECKKRGWFTLKLNVLGQRSWPDRLVLPGDGKFYLVEFKRPVFGTVSEGQRTLFKKLEDAGYPVFITTSHAAALMYCEGAPMWVAQMEIEIEK